MMSGFLRTAHQEDDGSKRIDGIRTGHRDLQGDCVCTDDDAPESITMLAVGGEDHYLNFIPNRFSSRAAAFKERTGIDVRVVRLGDLKDLNEEILADVKAKVYDGYCFIPFITGSLVEQNGLADLTDFVRNNEDVDWTDVFPFNREVQAVYDNTVRTLPCDGDVHSLYYRKDLFEQYNIAVPRTWDEYTEVAKFFHGMSVPLPNGSGENVTLVGSCVGREPNCLDFNFFNILIHSSSTQAGGTRKGALFDPQNMNPLMQEAMAETLRHLENQIKYGPEDELTSNKCSGLNIEHMNNGTCAMTYHWGDVWARHLLNGSVLGGNLGIAHTPGVTKVLDRSTGKLVTCTEEICPYGDTYEDIGRVNRAPYAAAGGWSVGVSAGVSPGRRDAMAEFFGYVCGSTESIEDVIPFAEGPLFTGTDPYRKSHFDINKWVERGYPRDGAEQYQETINAELSSPNTVLDVRFPEAETFLNTMNSSIFEHLRESQTVEKTHEDRMAVARSIEEAWRQINRDYDNRDDTTVPLLVIYQKSLNVYSPEGEGSGDELSTGAIVGIVLGCCAFVAIVAGLLAFFLIKRERKKTNLQWKIEAKDIRLTGEVIGEGSFGVVTKAYLRGTPVAVKASQHSYNRMESDASMSVVSSYKQMKEDLAVLVKLRNPYIVQTLGAVVERRQVLLVFEFMENGDLASVLDNPTGVAGGAGNAVERQWALQVAKGLEFLHNTPAPHGPLLHGDLRASNVLVDSSYNAQVSSYALEASVIGGSRSQGSMLWMAPEVLNGATQTKESDIYSYGMLLYEIMSRAKPFLVRRFSRGTLTEITESTNTASTVSALTSDEFMVKPEEEERIEFFGEQNGQRSTIPELISLVSDLTIEPAVRPTIPRNAPHVLRDLCVECWNKNPMRRPKIEEIVERLTDASSPSNLTQQLVQRSSVFNSILPHHVQDALSRGETVPPEKYEEVTVIFSDIVGFTATSSKLTAEQVGDLIRRLFTKFDALATKYKVKKLDVIGDAFLGVSGLPERMLDHAPRAACFALEATAAALETPICLSKPAMGTVQVRFGLATGPVVATVIGSAQHPKYTLFGTTVNTASRMESSSEPSKVQCTVETADLIREQSPSIGVQFRKKMDIKGRGEMETFWVSPPAEGFSSALFKPGRSRKSSRFARHNDMRTQSSTLSTSESVSFAETDPSAGEGERTTQSPEVPQTEPKPAFLSESMSENQWQEPDLPSEVNTERQVKKQSSPGTEEKDDAQEQQQQQGKQEDSLPEDE